MIYILGIYILAEKKYTINYVKLNFFKPLATPRNLKRAVDVSLSHREA